MRDLGNNIRIAQLSPGIVKTEFLQVMMGDKAKADATYQSLDWDPLQAIDMANCVKFILEAPKHVQVHDILVRPTFQKT